MGSINETKWNDEIILTHLEEMVKEKGMKRMPSKAEVVEHFGNHALACAITKRKGFKGYAEILGLPMKDSDTQFGKGYEKLAMEQIIVQGYDVEQMTQNYPYDLLVEENIKIDVKASRLYLGKHGNFYSFNLEKKNPTCDLFILYCVGSQNEIKHTLVIPSCCVTQKTQIGIGENKSKYFIYENKWEILEKYANLYKELEVLV